MGDDTRPAGIYQPHTPQLQSSLYEIYREMRDHQPIYRDPRNKFYIATRYDDVASILQDADTYSNAGVEESKLLMPMIVYMDGARHKSLRMLLSRVFTPKRVADLEPKIRASAQRLLDESAKQSRCDFMRSFASQLPSIVICDLIGIPDERREAFLSYTEAMIETGPESHPIEEPAAKIYAEFETLLAERGREPRDDLMSALLAADVDGHGLSHRELLGFCFNLIIGGTDTTMNLIGSGAVALAREPEQRRALSEEPTKIPDAIEEMLRFESPTQTLPRRPTRDVELHGVTIPADSRLLVCYGAANHDERAFEEPERFDFTVQRTRHLAFGLGTHHCLGTALARLEGRIAFEELLGRHPDYIVHDDGGWVTSRWARSHPSIEIELNP
ncbi:MAG: cytochrome P450 [Deltaproteobacteria bacterium]|nr:cytochrome P450 [Deltaproteobacteria bacterium]MBW2725932.1 cytochrome P450 [Deltaproteobacteria bacterium]